MADGIVQLPADSTGKKVDTSELTVGANTVERQRVIVADPTSATGVANVVEGDSGQNAQVLTGSRKEVAFTTTTVQAVASTDISNYRWISVHINTQGTSSTVTFQGSNDNTNWVNVALQTAAAVGASAPATSTTTAGIILAGPANYRYFRLNVTGISAGTTAGTIEFFSVAPALPTGQTNVTQGGTATSAANSWFTKLSDGTNTTAVKAASTAAAAADPAAVVSLSPNSPAKIFDGTNTATVKAASTAAAAADTSFVVGLSPNSPLPTGSNTIGALSANQTINLNQIAGTAADTNSGNKSAGTLRVVLATDQPNLTSALNVSAVQSGTWTVQPGNTANTTAWLMKQGDPGFTKTTDTTTFASGATPPVSVQVALNGAPSVITQFYGTYGANAVMNYEVSRDGGTTWYSVSSIRYDATGNVSPATASTLGANGSTSFASSTLGATHYRVRMSTVPASGTVSVDIIPVGSLFVPTQINSIIQNTPSFKVTDGTNTANVKAASTAAVATDPALVVAVSPNNTVKVDGSAVTQPVSAASLPLPAGAATSAKQPALGTAGAASADVITVQGVASMTALKVDGSGVTQPVSGTVTANVGTTNGLALDATLTGGTAQTKITDGTNVAAVKAASTAAVATDKAVVVAVSPNNTVKVDGTATTQPVSAASLPLPSGASTSAKQPTLGTAGSASADVITVQGIASMTALKVDGSAVTQPVSGTVTVQQATAANLKVDLSGTAANATALKVDGSAVTQPVSGTVTANIGTSGSLALDTTLTGGTQQTKITDGTNVATVKAASTAAVAADKSVVVALSPNTNTPAIADVSATGSLTAANANGTAGAATAGSAIVLASLNGASSAVAQCTTNTAFTGTIRFEASLDGGTTWTAIDICDASGTQNAVFGSTTTTVALGSLYESANIPGATNIRLVCTAFTSGSSVWTLRAAFGTPAQMKLAQGGSNQIGTIRVSDGTNTSAVKAASTAAVATDPALVVAVSPNNTVASTQSGTWTVQPGNTANTTPWLTKIHDGTTAAVVKAASTAAVAADPALVVAVSPNNTIPINSAQVGGTTIDTNSGNKSAGTQRIVIATDQPNLTTPLNTALATATSGGLLVATGTIGATLTAVKASAGQVYGWYFYNANASVAYIQFFDLATGSVTLGTTVPKYSLGIPGTSGANVMNPIGIAHGTAITIAITTTRGGLTAPGSTVDYNIFYA